MAHSPICLQAAHLPPTMEEGSRSSDQKVTIRLHGSHSLSDPLFILGTHVVAKVNYNADNESQTEYLLALVVGYNQERNEYTVWDVDVEPAHPSGKLYCVPCTDLARFPRRRTYVKGQRVLSRWPIDGDPKMMSSVFYSVEICGTIDQDSVQVRSNQDDSITVVDVLDIALPPELPEPDMEELKRLRKMLRKKEKGTAPKEKGIAPAAGLPEPDVEELKRLRKIARTEETALEKSLVHKSVEHKSEHTSVDRKSLEHKSSELKPLEHMAVEHKPVVHIDSRSDIVEPEEPQKIREWRVRLGLAPESWAPPRGGSGGEVPAPAPALCELVADNLAPGTHLKPFKLKAPKQRRVGPNMFAEEMDFETACSN